MNSTKVKRKLEKEMVKAETKDNKLSIFGGFLILFIPFLIFLFLFFSYMLNIIYGEVSESYKIITGLLLVGISCYAMHYGKKMDKIIDKVISKPSILSKEDFYESEEVKPFLLLEGKILLSLIGFIIIAQVAFIPLISPRAEFDFSKSYYLIENGASYEVGNLKMTIRPPLFLFPFLNCIKMNMGDFTDYKSIDTWNSLEIGKNTICTNIDGWNNEKITTEGKLQKPRELFEYSISPPYNFDIYKEGEIRFLSNKGVIKYSLLVRNNEDKNLVLYNYKIDIKSINLTKLTDFLSEKQGKCILPYEMNENSPLDSGDGKYLLNDFKIKNSNKELIPISEIINSTNFNLYINENVETNSYKQIFIQLYVIDCPS